MRYFPISIDTKGKKVAVLGGGKIACKKIKNLLASELTFYVFSKDFDKNILSLQNNYKDRIFLEKMLLTEDFDIKGFDLCMIATDDASLNEKLMNISQKNKIPFLNVQNSEKSDYILNKTVIQDNIIVGVSTGGKSPTVSKLIGEEIKTLLSKYSKEKIEKIIQIREYLKNNKENDIDSIITNLFNSDMDMINTYMEDVIEDKTRDKSQ